MSVEGILVEDVFLDPSPMSFDDCLFKVHLQQQYSAARELEVRAGLKRIASCHLDNSLLCSQLVSVLRLPV